MAVPTAKLAAPLYLALGVPPFEVPGPAAWAMFYQGLQGVLDHYLPAWATGPLPAFALGTFAIVAPALPYLGHARVKPKAPQPMAAPRDSGAPRPTTAGGGVVEDLAGGAPALCNREKPGDPLYTCVLPARHFGLHKSTGADNALRWE